MNITNITKLTGITRGSGGEQIFDYYVATTGNDGNPGTKALPFLTIHQANITATTGQSVWVESGTYLDTSETFVTGINWSSNGAIFKSSGTTSSLIAMSGIEPKTFTGFTFDRNSTGTYILNTPTGTSNATFNNCNFINPTTAFMSSASGTLDGFAFNNCTIESGTTGIGTIYNTGITFNTCSITGLIADGFYRLAPSGTMTVKNCNISMAGGYLCYARGAGDYYFTDNTITTTAGINRLFKDASALAMDIYFEGNNFTSTDAIADELLSFKSSRYANVYIRDNVINVNNIVNTDEIILIIGTTASEVTGNTITCTHTGTATEILVQAGTPASSTTLISNNTIYATHESGFNISVGYETAVAAGANADKITSVISDNTIYSAYFYNESATGAVHGIHTGYMKDFEITDNNIYGAGIAIGAEHDGTATTGSGITGNSIFDSKTYIRLKGSSSTDVANNELKAVKTFSDVLFLADFQLAGEHSLNTDFNNNTLYAGAGVTLTNWVKFDTGSTPAVIDYDTVYGVDSTPEYIIETNTYSTWAAIQGAGWEANGSNTNPY